MKSFVILQQAFVSLLCDSPQVFESSRWSGSDTHRPANTHTHPQTQPHTHTHRVRSVFLMRIHFPCDTYGDDNVIFGNLSSSLLFCSLEAGLLRATWHFHSTSHVYKQSKWKSFTTVFPFYAYCHLAQKRFGDLAEQMHPQLVLFMPRHSSNSRVPSKHQTMRFSCFFFYFWELNVTFLFYELNM